MSRKRTFSTAKLSCEAESSEEEYNYISPGCYCTPQIVYEKPQRYEGLNYEQHFPVGDFHRPETYVLDQCGNVIMLNQMQHQQEAQILIIDNFPLLEFEGPSLEEAIGFEIDPGVSPRKKERFEHEYDGEEEEEEEDVKSKESPLPKNIYRANEGYLVEEPPDEESDKSTKGSKDDNCADRA